MISSVNLITGRPPVSAPLCQFQRWLTQKRLRPELLVEPVVPSHSWWLHLDPEHVFLQQWQTFHATFESSGVKKVEQGMNSDAWLTREVVSFTSLVICSSPRVNIFVSRWNPDGWRLNPPRSWEALASNCKLPRTDPFSFTPQAARSWRELPIPTFSWNYSHLKPQRWRLSFTARVLATIVITINSCCNS